jgi:dipeptidyl-peptidase-4
LGTLLATVPRQLVTAINLRRFLGAVLFAVGVAHFANSPGAAAEPPLTSDRLELTIDRLYSLPSLIGTAPGGFAWSGDGRQLAFLWNDQGFPFRDVWTVDVDDPELRPIRWTRLAPSTEQQRLEADPVAAAVAQEQLERDAGVRSVLWHPDGEHLLISFDGDLWWLAAGSGPRRITQTAEGEAQAAFSPDGATLSFLREGDLWSMPLDVTVGDAGVAPVATRMTAVAGPGVELTAFEWSPDGSRLKVVETDRRGVAQRGIPDYLAEETTLSLVPRPYPGEEPVRQRLGLVMADGGEVEWLTLSDSEPDMLLSSRWSPDGAWLAVDTSDLYAKDRRIYTVESAPGRVARVVAVDRDPLNETFYYWRIAWSTDSQWLFFLSDREDDYHVYAVAPSGSGETRRLTRGAWAVSEMHPVPEGLVVVGNQGRAEERQLFRVPVAGGAAVRLSQRPGTYSPVVAPGGRHAAMLFSNDEVPPDLILSSLGDPVEERRVTGSPLVEFERYSWSRPRYVTFPSHVDGTTLHGRLTLPADFDPGRSYPAVLGSVYTDSVRNQWGGRVAHPTWGLDHYLAQEGYVLLNVDMRGSWGRGRAHRRGIRLDYGGMDIEDLESGVRFLAREGYVDMDRVGIWGSSYGGLMTAMSLFRKPELYAAGVAGAPATNVRHALTGQMAVMMRPQDQPDEYDDSSPYLHAHGLEDPLMIIHGMRDRVVLFKDSVTLVQRLILLGKDVELVALPDAGHGWDAEGLAQTRFAFKKLVAHFDRHLKGPQDREHPDAGRP